MMYICSLVVMVTISGAWDAAMTIIRSVWIFRNVLNVYMFIWSLEIKGSHMNMFLFHFCFYAITRQTKFNWNKWQFSSPFKDPFILWGIMHWLVSLPVKASELLWNQRRLPLIPVSLGHLGTGQSECRCGLQTAWNSCSWSCRRCQ